MAIKKKASEPDPVAAAMVQKRWDRTTPEQRSEIARKMAEARWGKKAAGKKAAKKAGKKRG